MKLYRKLKEVKGDFLTLDETNKVIMILKKESKTVKRVVVS